MDLLSVATAIAGILKTSAGVVKSFSDLRTKYQNASLTISSICCEMAILSASLAQMYLLFSQKPETMAGYFESQVGLFDTCDAALTGCVLLYTCLEEELKDLRVAAETHGGD